jgi:hypothetical protein
VPSVWDGLTAGPWYADDTLVPCDGEHHPSLPPASGIFPWLDGIPAVIVVPPTPVPSSHESTATHIGFRILRPKFRSRDRYQ